MITVQGYCPMGCGSTLALGEDGHVTCSLDRCPRPDAVTEILDDRETEHLVTFSETAFTVRHPLRERLDDALMACQLHEHIAGLSGPPIEPGRYRALAEGPDEWSWWPVRSS